MKGKAIVGLVLSIVALIIGWLGYLSFVGLPMAIVGLVLSVSGGKQLKAAGQPSGIATAGLVIGIIAVVLTGIAFFTCGLCAVCAAAADSAMDSDFDSLKDAMQYYN